MNSLLRWLSSKRREREYLKRDYERMIVKIDTLERTIIRLENDHSPPTYDTVMRISAPSARL